MEVITTNYNFSLVSISIFIAILASYVSFDLVGITWQEKQKKNYFLWLLFSASVLGTGIWTMHFIGMYAFQLPIYIHYQIVLTFLSLVLAIAGVFIGMYIIHHCHKPPYNILAALLMGSSIAGMHYVGMAGFHTEAIVSHNLSLVLASIAIALVSSWLALQIFLSAHAKKLKINFLTKLVVALIMGGAISSMHYLSMAAITFYHPTIINPDPDSYHIDEWHIHGGYVFNIVIITSIILLVVALFLSQLKKLLKKQLQEQLGLIKVSEQHLRRLIENSVDGFFIHDIEGNFIDVNQSAYQSLGYTKAELMQKNLFDIEISVTRNEFQQGLVPLIENGDALLADGIHKRKDGSEFPVSVNLQAFKKGDELLIFALVRDMTEKQKIQDYMHKLAMTDDLTGLANRRAFMENLNNYLYQSYKNKVPFAVLIIDIDHFKRINDTFGHDIGDLALEQFAEIAKEFFRQDDDVGRLGGEEFGVVLKDCPVDNALQRADKFRQVIEKNTLYFEDRSLGFTVSIGVCHINPMQTIMDATQILKNADNALYQSKENGRNQVTLYENEHKSPQQNPQVIKNTH